MKNLRIAFVFTILTVALNVGMASNGEPHPFTISAINFSMDLSSMEAFNIEVDYQEENGNLYFKTQKEITFLQVLNEQNELEYQLPVYGKSVVLDLDDLEKGNYNVNLILDGDKIVPGKFTK